MQKNVMDTKQRREEESKSEKSQEESKQNFEVEIPAHKAPDIELHVPFVQKILEKQPILPSKPEQQPQEAPQDKPVAKPVNYSQNFPQKYQDPDAAKSCGSQ